MEIRIAAQGNRLCAAVFTDKGAFIDGCDSTDRQEFQSRLSQLIDRYFQEVPDSPPAEDQMSIAERRKAIGLSPLPAEPPLVQKTLDKPDGIGDRDFTIVAYPRLEPAGPDQPTTQGRDNGLDHDDNPGGGISWDGLSWH